MEKQKEKFFFINRFDPDAKWFVIAVAIGGILCIAMFALLVYDIARTIKMLLA